MMNKKIQKSKIFELPKSKKGQGISINVIIIAAIALLVLVILSVLLLRGGGQLADGTACSGGQCAGSCSDIGGGTHIINPTGTCPNEGEVCCIPLGG